MFWTPALQNKWCRPHTSMQSGERGRGTLIECQEKEENALQRKEKCNQERGILQMRAENSVSPASIFQLPAWIYFKKPGPWMWKLKPKLIKQLANFSCRNLSYRVFQYIENWNLPSLTQTGNYFGGRLSFTTTTVAAWQFASKICTLKTLNTVMNG